MQEHDIIELAEPVGGWPSGSRGTVLADSVPGFVLVEFGAASGTPDFVSVPVSSVRKVSASAA